MTKKRARRTREEWSALVLDMSTSGRSMSVYARERGISLTSLSYWKKQLEGQRAGASVVSKAKTAFSEIVVVPRVRATPSRIEVVTRHGSAIRIEGAFDASLLREVLRAAESC